MSLKLQTWIKIGFIFSLSVSLTACSKMSSYFADSNAQRSVANVAEYILPSISQPRVSDRNYVASVLTQVYGLNPVNVFSMAGYGTCTTSTTTPTSNNVVASLIYADISDFGGPCDVYSQSDACASYISGCIRGSVPMQSIFTQAPTVSSMTSAREGAMTRTCETINSTDTLVTQAVKNLDTGEYLPTQLPSTPAMLAAYDAFYPGKIPSSDVLTNLTNVVQSSQSTSGSTPLDGWRFLFLTLCLAPDWQTP